MVREKNVFGKIALLAAAGLLFAGCGSEEEVVQSDAQTRGGEVAQTLPDPDAPADISPPEAGVNPDIQLPERDDAFARPAEPASELERQIRGGLAQSEQIQLSEAELEDLEINVQGDAISLSGTVRSDEIAQTIEEQVRELTGIEEIENNLVASR